MRALKLAALILFGALVVLAAAACGGDGGEEDDGGDGPAGEGQEFNVEGLMNIALLEEFVSAVPALQGTTNYSGAGSGTASLGFSESGTIDVFGMQIDFSLASEDGQTINVKATARPDESSGSTEAEEGTDGEGGVQGWTLSIAFDLDVQDGGGGGTLTPEEALPFEGGASLNPDGDVAGASVSTPSDLATHLLDEDGNEQGIVTSVVLSLTDPAIPPPSGDETGGAPPAGPNYAENFGYLGIFGVDPGTLNVTSVEDEANDQFFPDPSQTPTFVEPYNDILKVDQGVLNVDEDSAAKLGHLYPCNMRTSGIQRVCSQDDSAFPSGTVRMFAVHLGASLPTEEELGENTCNANMVFNDPGGTGWQAQAPFTNDLFISHRWWVQTVGGAGQPYAIGVSDLQTPIPDANAQSIVDWNSGTVFHLIPNDLIPESTTYRAGVDCGPPFGTGTGVRGADTIGGVTSTAPPQQLKDLGDAMTVDIPGLFDEFSGEPGSVAPEDCALGDANGDGGVNIADPIWIVAELFLDGPKSPCPDQADANEDGTVDGADASFLIAAQFLGGAVPCGGECR